MSDDKVWRNVLDRPKISLALCCVAWKAFLFCIALLSPGLGYDTSTTLLQPDHAISEVIPRSSWSSRPWLEKLVRWDAIYFTQIARRGYVWEQEWAFGWGFTKLIAFISKGESLLPEYESS